MTRVPPGSVPYASFVRADSVLYQIYKWPQGLTSGLRDVTNNSWAPIFSWRSNRPKHHNLKSPPRPSVVNIDRRTVTTHNRHSTDGASRSPQSTGDLSQDTGDWFCAWAVLSSDQARMPNPWKHVLADAIELQEHATTGRVNVICTCRSFCQSTDINRPLYQNKRIQIVSRQGCDLWVLALIVSPHGDKNRIPW